MPHISLVFREMWDTTKASFQLYILNQLPVKSGGIPHLAKNKRGKPRPANAVLLLSVFETLVNLVPVDRAPPSRKIVRPLVLVFEVVRVFPNVIT